MSKVQKTIYALIISFPFIFSIGDTGAMMARSAGSGKGTPTVNQNQVSKSCQSVRIANNVLYLENNKSYDLRGVNVIDRTDKRLASGNKKLAELMFVNGVLKEVILR